MHSGDGWKKQRSATVTILIVNVVIFVIHHLIETVYQVFPVSHYFGLSLRGLSSGWIWQLLTFQFLHAGFLHILLNSWGIYVFGRSVEDAIGRGKFLTLYLGSGAAGGLLHVIGSGLLPTHFGGYGASVVGASAGLFGLIGAFGKLFPHERLTLLLFFVLPITLTGRMLMIISGVIALVGILIPSNGGVAEGAHLGGLLAGLAYIEWFRYSEWNLSGWFQKFKPKAKPTRLKTVTTIKGAKGVKTFDVEEEFPADFVSKEVDPILDKISQHGIQSLTERERRILEAARAKMAKR